VFCPNAIDWGNVATWLAGIATVLTLWFGIYQWATLRRDAQSERSLKLQYEHIAQASCIFAWIDADHIVVGNSSTEPVYAVVVHYVYMDGRDPGTAEETEARIRQIVEQPGPIGATAREAARSPISQYRAVIQTLPPGNYLVAKAPPMASAGVEIAFTDRANTCWVRRVTGELVDTRDSSAVDYYAIQPPVEYDQLTRWS
jgi:hypothetical protein